MGISNKQINKKYLIVGVIILLLVASFITPKLYKKEINNEEVNLDKKQFAMYKENDNGEYEEVVNTNKFPEGFKLNLEESYCVDNNQKRVENILNYQNGKVSVASNKTVFCTLYFDKQKTLANVIKSEVANGLAVEYMGEGNYTDTEHPFFTNHIYHWLGGTTTKNSQIQDKWNVVFGGICWQMIRTTENGGVKLLYNGDARKTIVDGETKYDCKTDRPRHVGQNGTKTTISLNKSTTTSENYWYSDTYEIVGTSFKLSGTPEQVRWTETNSEGLIGKYTCRSNNINGTCTTLFKIDSYYSTSAAYAIPFIFKTYSQIGSMPINEANSITNVGYMHNEIIELLNNKITTLSNILTIRSIMTSQSINYSTLFSNEYNYNNETYEMTNTKTAQLIKANSENNDYNDLIGMYTCGNSYTSCTTLYYVVAVAGGNYYRVEATNGIDPKNNSNYKFGTSIQDNKNGTYTISNINTINMSNWTQIYNSLNNSLSTTKYYWCSDNTTICTYGNMRLIRDTSLTSIQYYNLEVSKQSIGSYTLSSSINGNELQNPTEIIAIDWYKDYNSYKNKYICLSGDTICSNNNLFYIYNIGGSSIDESYSPINTFLKLSNNVNYNIGTNKYLLDMTDENAFEEWDWSIIANRNKIGKAHYVCLDNSNNVLIDTIECEKVGYIYYVSGNHFHFIPLSNGEYISTDIENESRFKNEKNLLYKMLYADDVNTKDSTIKEYVDGWYDENLKQYESYIDKEEIYCNDRRISDFGSWNENSTNMGIPMNFTNSVPNGNINCQIKTDSFSATSTTFGNGDLDNPVGLASAPEMYILGNAQNSSKIRTTESSYSLISPNSINASTPISRGISTNGSLMNVAIGKYTLTGVRPSIALTQDVEFSYGDGSTRNPYVIEEGMKNIEINDNTITVPNKAFKGERVVLFSDNKIVKSFKLNGALINSNEFTMPNETVSITDIVTVNTPINEEDYSTNKTNYYSTSITSTSGTNYTTENNVFSYDNENKEWILTPDTNARYYHFRYTPTENGCYKLYYEESSGISGNYFAVYKDTNVIYTKDGDSNSRINALSDKKREGYIDLGCITTSNYIRIVDYAKTSPISTLKFKVYKVD